MDEPVSVLKQSTYDSLREKIHVTVEHRNIRNGIEEYAIKLELKTRLWESSGYEMLEL